MESDDMEREFSLIVMADGARGIDANAEEWFKSYGFPHHCTCAEDVAEGRVEEVPECYLGMVDEAMAALKHARAALVTIAEAETDDAEVLKALAGAMYYQPRD